MGTVTTSQPVPLGLTGATAATRYVGANATGPPITGTWAVGDLAVDRTAPAIYICTVAGSPGTWGIVGAGGAVSSVFTRTGAVVATAGDYTGVAVGGTADAVAAGGVTNAMIANGTIAPIKLLGNANSHLSTTNYNALTQTSITAVDTTNLRCTIVADGTSDVKLEALMPRIVPPVANALRVGWLKDVSTNLFSTGAGFDLIAGGLAEASSTLIGRDKAPTAASHTYDLAYSVGGGTGTIDGSDQGPIWISVTLVPPTT